VSSGVALLCKDIKKAPVAPRYCRAGAQVWSSGVLIRLLSSG
jgi:hypothetical protein